MVWYLRHGCRCTGSLRAGIAHPRRLGFLFRFSGRITKRRGGTNTEDPLGPPYYYYDARWNTVVSEMQKYWPARSLSVRSHARTCFHTALGCSVISSGQVQR